MKVSVAMTTYNGEKYIEEQLESLKNQSRVADEIIIFDDCSSDDTVVLINKYIEKWQLNKWHLFKNTVNQGWIKNFHKCIEMTTGDIVFFCDQDDVWDKHKIEKVMDIIEKIPEAEAVVHKTKLIDSIGGRLSDNPESFPYNSLETKEVCKNRLNEKFTYTNSPGCTMAVRKDLIERCKHFSKDDLPHDALYWKLATAMQNAYYIDEALIDYRIHANNASKPENDHKYVAKANEVRIKEAEYFKNQLEKISEICADSSFAISPKNRKIIEQNLKFNMDRCAYLESHKLGMLIRLMLKLRYYRAFKMFVGDILAVLKR